MPENIKHIIAYILSLDIILLSIATWLTTFESFTSKTLAILVSLSALVISYYTIQHIKEKIKAQRLDNELKKIELLKAKKSLKDESQS